MRDYLIEYEREQPMPVKYADMLRFNSRIPLYDKNKVDTLWETVFYAQDDMIHIYDCLKMMYAILKSGGDKRMMNHLVIDRIDFCPFANSLPFRVRIMNELNDNFDYFYIKRADASRVYGLELEHILSPNRMSFYTDGDTLIEEHIIGMPGDQFIETYLKDKNLNRRRLAKEFVKFNERCFIRLLGDMRPNNYNIQIIPDFDDTHYRIRAIDFDQQTYEGDIKIYMPQFFKQNFPIVKICMETITPETAYQYQMEERTLISSRLKTARYRLKELGDAVMRDDISTMEHVVQLRSGLVKHYGTNEFNDCKNMGEIVRSSLRMLARY